MADYISCTTHSYNLTDHIANNRSDSCSNYVISMKMQRVCSFFFEVENEKQAMLTFEIESISVFKVRKNQILEKCIKTLDRSNSSYLRELKREMDKLPISEFVKVVYSFKLRNKFSKK